ncbi:hypothetical protein KUTeg_015778 [Tegillarca granosa]|uniref:Uncharacterized protein n=1 Tax=Tegillarca granosa TaxID=220873 RepID=A0ABQ9ES14_TEGGR|nr:hypothetical protein KUTeg_015778 [Tegillarca granosa]
MDGKTAIEMSMKQEADYEDLRLETDDDREFYKSITRQNTRQQHWMKIILILIIISILLAAISPVITGLLFKFNLHETPRNQEDIHFRMIHLEKEVKNITSDLKQRQIEEKALQT